MKKYLYGISVLFFASSGAASLPDKITVDNKLNRPLFILGISSNGTIIKLQEFKQADNKAFSWTKNPLYDKNVWALYAIDTEHDAIYTYPGNSNTFTVASNSPQPPVKAPDINTPLTIQNWLPNEIYLIGVTSDGKQMQLRIFEPLSADNATSINWNISNDIDTDGQAWGLYMLDPKAKTIKIYPQGDKTWSISSFSLR